MKTSAPKKWILAFKCNRNAIQLNEILDYICGELMFFGFFFSQCVWKNVSIVVFQWQKNIITPLVRQRLQEKPTHWCAWKKSELPEVLFVLFFSPRTNIDKKKWMNYFAIVIFFVLFLLSEQNAKDYFALWAKKKSNLNWPVPSSEESSGYFYCVASGLGVLTAFAPCAQIVVDLFNLLWTTLLFSLQSLCWRPSVHQPRMCTSPLRIRSLQCHCSTLLRLHCKRFCCTLHHLHIDDLVEQNVSLT